MKRFALPLLALLLTASPLLALKHRPVGGIGVERLHQAFDRNGDGLVTRGEWLHNLSMFDGMDADRDGVLTREELVRGRDAARARAKKR